MRLTNTNLKILAILFMLIDHIAATSSYLYNEKYVVYIIMRIIGRLAFPIFAFLLVEGFFHTRNRHKYLLRLSIFALISEVPFDLAFYRTYIELSHQNVFFTLSIGLIAIMLFDKYVEENFSKAFGYLVLMGFTSLILMTDYNIIGVLIIFSFYYYRSDFRKLFLALTILNGLFIIEPLITIVTSGTFNFETIIQIFAVLALFLIKLYNHERGYPLKYLFYIFYPAHLVILYLINL
ncbi:MAG: hypothetical protein GX490_10675 [Bacilli bacterium]|nr:hypothetical protein [Bacilli bacterium]